MAQHAAATDDADAAMLCGEARGVVSVAARALHEPRRLFTQVTVAAAGATMLAERKRKDGVVLERRKRLRLRASRRLAETKQRWCERWRPARGTVTTGAVLRQRGLRRITRYAAVERVNVAPLIIASVTSVAIRGSAPPGVVRSAHVTLATLGEHVHARQRQTSSPMKLNTRNVRPAACIVALVTGLSELPLMRIFVAGDALARRGLFGVVAIDAASHTMPPGEGEAGA